MLHKLVISNVTNDCTLFSLYSEEVFKVLAPLSKNERHILLYVYHSPNGMPPANSEVGTVGRLAVDKYAMNYH
jgi:hypothetical protein